MDMLERNDISGLKQWFSKCFFFFKLEVPISLGTCKECKFLGFCKPTEAETTGEAPAIWALTSPPGDLKENVLEALLHYLTSGIESLRNVWPEVCNNSQSQIQETFPGVAIPLCSELEVRWKCE